MENIWPFVQVLLVVGLPILAGVLTSYVIYEVKKYKLYKPDTFFLLEQIVTTCVKAAEQVGLTQEIDSKLQYALNNVQIWLDEEGIELDIDTILTAIEAAVWEQFNKNKEVDRADD